MEVLRFVVLIKRFLNPALDDVETMDVSDDGSEDSIHENNQVDANAINATVFKQYYQKREIFLVFDNLIIN